MGAADTVKICVVGPKGCGKSALVKLLVEGEDIRKTSAPTVAARYLTTDRRTNVEYIHID